MKRILLLLFAIISLQSMAQNKSAIQISAQGKTVDVFLDSNNSNKTITLNSKAKVGKLVIINANAKNEAAYNRSYSLVNDKDEDLKLSIIGKLIGNNCVSLADIFGKTQKGKIYKLYTVALPKDPNIAATVRVRRVLLCNIAVK